MSEQAAVAVPATGSDPNQDLFARETTIESLTGRVVRRYLRHRLAMDGLAVFLVIALLAIFAPVLSRHDPDAVDLLAGEGGGVWRVRTPKLNLSVNGAGDAIAALFLVHYLDSGSACEALGRSASSIFGLLKRTEEAGSREILTVAAQDEFVRPTWTFAAEPV